MRTYAIKWDEKILVTEKNKSSLEWYKFIQEELSDKDKIENDFTQAVEQLTAWISQEEKDSWTKQESEARNVLDWWTSELLSSLCIDWETVEVLANKIILKADYLSLETVKLLQIKRQKLKDLES